MTDPSAPYDLAVLGGGIHGAGIARDAAGRGLRVILIEQGDLASATSSASSKLVHGGLRYLEQGAFRLVREALNEREVLLQIAPHLTRPMRFVLPVGLQSRSPFALRVGLWLYDWLGNRKRLPPSQTLDLAHHRYGAPLQRSIVTGFEYSDCWVDDARLVVLNALDASMRGADIRTGARCVHAERDQFWRLGIIDRGKRVHVEARVLVNATGPWISHVARDILRVDQPLARLVKGSHIVTRQLFDHDGAYIFQNDDGRVIFALPFAGNTTLIGTTDIDFTGDLAVLAPTAEEIAYLCRAVNRYFRDEITPSDVIRAFSGVRALEDDRRSSNQNVTRDYKIRMDTPTGMAPLATIYGGKLTTYRRLAEGLMNQIASYFPQARPAWTATQALPGGDFDFDKVGDLIAQTRGRWPFLSQADASRMVRAYGTRISLILGDARQREDLGRDFGAGLSEAEVRYLVAKEWARSADDILWRRTKLAMSLSQPQQAELDAYLQAFKANPA